MKEYSTIKQFTFFKTFSFLIIKFFFCIVIFGSVPSWAAVENIVMTIIPGKDGVAPFDLDDLPGHDSSDSNKIVRTHDRFDYRVSYKAIDAAQVSFIFTAPVGIYWLSVGANTTVCNGTGGPQISGGGRVLTCPRKPTIPLEPLTFPQIESFELPAIASNFPNGQIAEIQISAGSATAISEGITISAKPKSEFFVLSGGPSKGYRSSVYGAFYNINIHFGVKTNSSGAAINTIKGIEAPKVPITLALSDMPAGTELASCESASCSQPSGPGTVIFITFTDLNNRLVNAASCSGGSSCTGGGLFTPSGLIANFYPFSVPRINLFTPFGSTYPSGSKNSASLHFANPGPEKSISDAVNYLGYQSGSYAANITPGYAPSFNTCPDSHSCVKFDIDRTIRTDLYMNFHGTFHTPSTNLIFGDSEASTNNPGDGAESVMPGHLFSAMYPVFTSTQAEEASTNVGSCIVWNPAKMNLQETATLKLGAGAEFFRTSHLSFPNVTSSNRILEYSAKLYSTDAERKNALCGIAGDGSSEWFTDPNSVPGGITEVSSIRYKYIPPLQPGTVLGLVMPFRRPTTAYSLGLGTLSLAPWFSQFWSDDKARIPSQYNGSGYSMWGGRVTTVDALFRHRATMAGSIAPGNSLTMTITPLVIGTPITGIDATVRNAKIRVNMPDTCLEPVEASLPSFGAITTLPNYGLDGIPCTGDSGEKPAVVTFNLGDIPAPGGALTAGYQGHVVTQNSFTFNVLATANAPVKSVSWTSVDSADNDPTPVYHSNSGSVSIAGVAGFLVSKSSSGTSTGKIGPNETFNYIINFGNGGSVITGKGRFVDILPFDGDSRGTVGLGSGKMIVTGLSAGMKIPSQGTVGMEVSTDNPVNIQAALLLPNNEDGLTGINWVPYSAGTTLPENVSAVRFTTSSNLNPGFSGFGSIQVKAPTIRGSTNTFNNVWGRTEALAGDDGTVKVLNGISVIKIQGLNGGTLKGLVFKDLNENGVLDSGETGIPNSIVSITCKSGSCLTAPQGLSFSVLTDANGNYSFETNLLNKIYPNINASGIALANFDGVVAGTWTITESPPSSSPFVNVSRNVGTINAIVSGQGSGRSINNVVMLSSGLGVNYNFGEQLAHGKITVTKNVLNLPAGATGPFNFTFHATCDLPSAGTVYTAILNNYPTVNSVDIINIPAGSTCAITETNPTPPSGFAWANPVISDLNPTGQMEAGGTKTVSVTNQFLDGFSISKSVLSQPTEVTGQFATYDIEYKIEVINRLTNAQTYTLLDNFEFEPDLEIVGAPTISTSSNVTGVINSSFTGKGTNSNQIIVSNETIDGGSVNTPSIESYIVKIRFKLIGFSSSNNTCNNTASKGLFNIAILSFDTKSLTVSACADTPSNTPVFLQLRKLWKGGLVGDSATVPATNGYSNSNTSAFKSVNAVKDVMSSSNKISLPPLDIGKLPVIEYNPSKTETATQVATRYSTSSWSCSDGVNINLTVLPGSNLQIPTESVGRTLVCTIISSAVNISTTKTASPPSGTTVGINDILTYTISTQVSGGPTPTDILLTDTLDPGLTLISQPSQCSLNQSKLVCTLASGSSIGTHTFIYQAKVNSKALNNQPAGVKNSVISSTGACASCSTTHGLWNARISKTSNANPKGIYVGDTIQYTVSLEVTGGPTTQEIIITDIRSIGLNIEKLPQNCSQSKLVMTCKLASGSATGVYTFIYNAVVTDDALDTVSNVISSKNASCKDSCKTASKVIRNVVLRISKTANPNRVKLGDFVRYEILVENLTGPTANNFKIVDKAAPGLSYVKGSAKLIGDDDWKITSTYPLIFSGLNLAKNKKIIISYLMRVGAGTGRGCVNNLAQADDDRHYVTSNPSSICVSRYADPDFEDSRIFGLVFNDKNGNGVQDEQEEGLPGIRLVTPSGLVLETDAYGRYHVEGLDPGELSRGRNFVMMLDETTLTKGGVLTTQNPLVKRVTWAIPVQFNFGVRQQLYKVNLAQMNSEENDQEEEVMEANDSSNPMRAVPRSKINTSSFTQANRPSLVPSKKTKTYVIATDGLFQFGKSDENSIIISGSKNLKVFAEKIKAEFSIVESIILKAHTDRIGDNEKNLLLSYQRAETIKKLIIQAGVQSKVFDLNGIGSAEPIVKCNGLNQAKTIECLAPNRRFEVVVTGEPVPPKGSP